SPFGQQRFRRRWDRRLDVLRRRFPREFAQRAFNPAVDVKKGFLLRAPGIRDGYRRGVVEDSQEVGFVSQRWKLGREPAVIGCIEEENHVGRAQELLRYASGAVRRQVDPQLRRGPLSLRWAGPALPRIKA